MLNVKYTPEMNCRTRTMGTTTAPALLPVLGTDDIAIPSTVHIASPRKNTQTSVSHADASVGMGMPRRKRATSSIMMIWAVETTST